jgi:hypothetical protein
MHCTPTKAKSPRFLKRGSTENNSHSTYFGAEIVVRASDTRNLHDFLPWQQACFRLNHHACWMRVFSTVRRAFAKRRVGIAGKESFRHKSRTSEGVAIRVPAMGKASKV